jgi:hypothetical protein
MDDPEFIEGKLDTAFITRFNERRSDTVPSDEERDLAIIAATLSAAPEITTEQTTAGGTRWAQAARTSSLTNKT